MLPCAETIAPACASQSQRHLRAVASLEIAKTGQGLIVEIAQIALRVLALTVADPVAQVKAAVILAEMVAATLDVTALVEMHAQTRRAWAMPLFAPSAKRLRTPSSHSKSSPRVHMARR